MDLLSCRHNPPTGYLAGSIRDGVMEDWAWREETIRRLSPHAVLLSPLGGKSYNPDTKMWLMSGVKPSARAIFKHDIWCIQHSDFMIVNLSALSDGYPNIGTLVEFGVAFGHGCLIYAIIDPGYRGHENAILYKLHPFLSEGSSDVFPTVKDCLDFVEPHIQVLSGATPHFLGISR